MLAIMTSAFGSASPLAAELATSGLNAYKLADQHVAASRLTTYALETPASGARAFPVELLPVESTMLLPAPTAGRPTIDPATGLRTYPAIPPRFVDRKYAALIHEASHKANLDPALVHAVIAVESSYNQSARSPKGAIGLMQVLPGTAVRYGVADPASSPQANLRAGTLYLRYLMKLFDDRIDLVLAAYNAGENAVIRYGHRIPPFPETRRYVPAVLARYLEWQEPTAPVPSSKSAATLHRVPPLISPAPVATRIQYMSGTVLDFDPGRPPSTGPYRPGTQISPF